MFEMEDGLRFDYRGSWASEGCHTSWEGEWRAVGERGTAKWDGFDTIEGEIVAQSGGFHSEFRPIGARPHSVAVGIEGSLKEFIGALRSGEKPLNGECHDNIKSFAMVIAAHESAKQGRRIALSELF
jgi:predicted dehydrogenase